MPSTDKVFGLGNQWYAAVFKDVLDIRLDERITARMCTPIFFMAAWLEAFKSRGRNDFEDISFFLNKRSAVWKELQNGPTDAKRYCVETWRDLLQNAYLDEWISCHVGFEEQKRVDHILAGLR